MQNQLDNKIKAEEKANRDEWRLKLRQRKMRRLNSSWQNLSEQFQEGREKVRILRQEREEEERRRQEEYKEVLEKIYARVAEQPTLFERQSKVSQIIMFGHFIRILLFDNQCSVSKSLNYLIGDYG